MPDLIDIREEDGIGFVKLNRPEKRNALNNQLVAELHAVFADLPKAMRCVVLHGEGAHFCAGLDLIERVQERTSDPEAAGPVATIRHSRGWARCFELIEFCEVPVISVLKGGVIGGGLELAAATHLRVAEASAFYQLPEGQRGIFVGGGASVRVPAIIGKARTIDMMLTGRKLSAAEGAELALSQYLVEEGAGLETARELAGQIVTNSPVANFAIINGMNHIPAMAPGQGLFTESLMATVTAAAVESNMNERILGFFEGRRAQKEEQAG